MVILSYSRSLFLMSRWEGGTSAEVDGLVIDVGTIFVPVFHGLDDSVESGSFDVFELSF